MSNPIVTILMSSFNDEEFIADSIQSVIDQDFADWEFIIIDDASTDETSSIIRKYAKKDSRFIFIKNKKNLGLTTNLNLGITKARGEFIARIDGDDKWLSTDKLTKQVIFLKENLGYALVGTWAKAIDTKNNKRYLIKYPSEDKRIRKVMLEHNCFVHSSVLIRKLDLDWAGNYNNTNITSQDYELWLELGKRRKLFNIPELMTVYRINPLGTSLSKAERQLDETLAIIKKNKSFYPNYLKSFLLWKCRKYYPTWFRGELSIKIKRIFKKYS